MFTHRQNRILHVLSDQERAISGTTLAAQIGVSVKTIHNDIKSLNTMVCHFGVVIEARRGYGFHLVYTGPESRRELDRILTENSDSDLEDVGKQAFMFCVLQMSRVPVTRAKLANELYSNKNVIRSMVHVLNRELQYHNVLIRSVPGQGYRITGSESSQRMFFIGYFERLKREPQLFRRFVIMEPMWAFTENKISLHLIERILNEHGLFLTQTHIERIRAYLVRVLLLEKDLEELTEDGFVVRPLKSMMDVSVALLNAFNVKQTESEQRLFSLYLLFLVNVSELDSLVQSAYSPVFQDYEYLIDRFFTRRNRLYRNIFEDVEALRRSVKSLVAVMIDENLIGYNRALVVDSDDGYDNEFTVAIEIASMLLFQFENLIQLRFNRSNVISLAILINLNFRANIWIPRQEVVLISHESPTYATLLNRRLSRRYKDAVRIQEAANEAQLRKLMLSTPDALIISDQKEELPGYNVMVVPNMLSSVRAISSLNSSLSTTALSNTSFLSRFSKESFYGQVTFSGMEDLISTLTTKYHCSEERAMVIQNNVRVREQRYISVVYGAAAAPRVYIDTISKPVIEVFTLKQPIYWNEHEIRLVFAVMLPGSYEYLTVVGRPLPDILGNAKLVQQLSESAHFDSFIRIITENLG